jgi:hypothetical protein
MIMSDEVVLTVGNVTIVQSLGNVCLIPPAITLQDLPNYYGTLSLPVSRIETVVKEKFADIKSLFGSWIECGDEDQMLADLYASRLIPSAQLDE